MFQNPPISEHGPGLVGRHSWRPGSYRGAGLLEGVAPGKDGPVKMSTNWARWSSVGFWILMVGLVGDFAVLFIKSGKLEKRLAAIFTILIAVGVAVEHFADAELHAPRLLTKSQQEQMVQKLKPFAGTPFVLAVDAEPEAINFMDDVASVLISAGWKREPAEHDRKTGLITTIGPLKAVAWNRSGIALGFRADGPTNLLVPADRLTTALEDAGFKVETGKIPETVSNNSDAVYVVIGAKDF
jgi:hypothetical protein